MVSLPSLPNNMRRRRRRRWKIESLPRPPNTVSLPAGHRRSCRCPRCRTPGRCRPRRASRSSRCRSRRSPCRCRRAAVRSCRCRRCRRSMSAPVPPTDAVGAVARIVAADDRLRVARQTCADGIGAVAAEQQHRAAVAGREDAVVLGAAVHRAGVAGLQNDRVVAAVAGDGRETRFPAQMLSSPARPTIVPGPVSPVWFRTSLPAVPVACKP